MSRLIVFFFFCLITALSLSITSCQKEYSVNNEIAAIATTAVNDSNYLDKIVSVDSTGARVDSVMYKYDNLKRLISIKDSTNSFYSKTLFSYVGTDTLPFKLTDTTYSSGVSSGANIIVKYFFYNANGKRIKDSSFRSFISGADRNRVSYYMYSANKIYGITTDTPYAYSVKTIWTDTASENANGNIVFSKRKKTYQSPTFLNSFYPDSSISNISYDFKQSPFFRFRQFAYDIFPFGETTYLEIGQNNNVTIMDEHIYQHKSMNQVIDNPYFYNLTTQYSYNFNGLLKAITDNSGNKSLFYYRSF